jgi:hypothetical protein
MNESQRIAMLERIFGHVFVATHLSSERCRFCGLPPADLVHADVNFPVTHYPAKGGDKEPAK